MPPITSKKNFELQSKWTQLHPKSGESNGGWRHSIDQNSLIRRLEIRNAPFKKQKTFNYKVRGLSFTLKGGKVMEDGDIPQIPSIQTYDRNHLNVWTNTNLQNQGKVIEWAHWNRSKKKISSEILKIVFYKNSGQVCKQIIQIIWKISGIPVNQKFLLKSKHIRLRWLALSSQRFKIMNSLDFRVNLFKNHIFYYRNFCTHIFDYEKPAPRYMHCSGIYLDIQTDILEYI